MGSVIHRHSERFRALFWSLICAKFPVFASEQGDGLAAPRVRRLDRKDSSGALSECSTNLVWQSMPCE